MALHDWKLIWNNKKLIRYQNNKKQDESVEIFSAKIDGTNRWFVTYIEKGHIYRFGSTNTGVSKSIAKKKAIEWMAVNK